MSEGPIKQWRDAHLPPRSVPQSQAVHMASLTKVTRFECGRTGRRPFAISWEHVTCSDCLAAGAADEGTDREVGSRDDSPS